MKKFTLIIFVSFIVLLSVSFLKFHSSIKVKSYINSTRRQIVRETVYFIKKVRGGNGVSL